MGSFFYRVENAWEVVEDRPRWVYWDYLIGLGYIRDDARRYVLNGAGCAKGEKRG